MYLSVKLNLALVAIQKCLVIFRDFLGPNTKKQLLHTHIQMPFTHLVISNSDGYRIGFLRLPIKNFLGDQHIFSSPLGLYVKLGFKISTCLRINSTQKKIVFMKN